MKRENIYPDILFPPQWESQGSPERIRSAADDVLRSPPPNGVCTAER